MVLQFLEGHAYRFVALRAVANSSAKYFRAARSETALKSRRCLYFGTLEMKMKSGLTFLAFEVPLRSQMPRALPTLPAKMPEALTPLPVPVGRKRPFAAFRAPAARAGAA